MRITSLSCRTAFAETIAQVKLRMLTQPIDAFEIADQTVTIVDAARQQHEYL